MKAFDINKIKGLTKPLLFEEGGTSTGKGHIQGGKSEEISAEKLLTGEFIKGLDPKSPVKPNAEVEKNEYIKFPDDGTVQKAVGDTHENGGVKVKLPDQTKIISDSLKLTKEQVKTLKEEFGLEASTKDTFAKVLDKFTKHIGLKKLNEEQEEVFSTLRKELEKKGTNEGARRVNNEYLSKKLFDIESKKKPVEEQRAKMFETLFDMQESEKKPENEPQHFKYGGLSESRFQDLCDQHGLTKEQGLQMLGELPKYKDAGTVGDPPYKVEFAYKPQGIKRLNEFLAKYGLDALPENASKAEVDKAAGAMQQEAIKSNPEDVYEFMLNESHAPNNKLIQKLKALGTYEPTNEGIKKAVEDGVLSKEDVLNAYNDNKWWYRAVLPKVEEATTEEVTDEVGETTEPKPPKREVGKGEETDTVDNTTVPTARNMPQLFFTPDQSTLPPSPMQAHLKADTTFGRIDPVKVGIEPNLQAISDSRQAMVQELDSLPPSSRASAIVSLLASTQAQENQAATAANQLNAQNQSSADLFNIGQASQENLYGNQNALNFEQRQMLSQAKTEEDLRNYLDYNQNVAMNNLQTQQRLNMLNSLYPEYQMNFMGTGFNFTPDGSNSLQDRSAFLAQYNAATTPESSSKKTV